MTNTVDKIITIAKAEVGYLEKASNSNLDSKTANAGDKNYTKYARDLDNIAGFYNGKKNGYPWCDVFFDWLMVQTYGVENAKQMINHDQCGAGVIYSKQYYKNMKRYYTSNPQKGDQIFFKDSKGTTCHTGVVTKVDSTYVYTIEGNTRDTFGVVANGGGVYEKKYKLNYPLIDGYGRPKYDIVSTTTITARDYLMKGDKGDKVRIMQENLIYAGYSCGSYGADGDFGDDSEFALKKFQTDNGLESDGLYGKLSKAKLEELIYKKKNSVDNSSAFKKEIIKKGQKHAINFTGVTIGVDGIVGSETRRMKARVLQHAMNLDYGKTIEEDGLFQSKSKEKLSSHYVEKGECQYMVTAAEILMELNGIDPNGIEYPGKYDNGLVNASKKFFGDDGLKITSSEFLKLIQ